MDIGEWLGAIPNAIGKFMYDAGIPDPMATAYANKQQFDLNKRYKEQLIQKQQFDNNVSELLAGVTPKLDKQGNPIYLPGMMGDMQRDIYINKMPVHEAIQKYGGMLSTIGNIDPHKMKYAGLSPEERAQSGLIANGLAMDAKSQAAHALDVGKFQHKSILENLNETLKTIAHANAEGASPELVQGAYNNLATALSASGLKPEVIKQLLMPIDPVADGRKDQMLRSNLEKNNATIAQGWARVAAAQARANGKGKGKEVDPSKIKLEKHTGAEHVDTAIWEKTIKSPDATPEQKAEARAKLIEQDELDAARLQRFRTHAEFYNRRKKQGDSDDTIDARIREQITNRSVFGEYGDDED